MAEPMMDTRWKALFEAEPDAVLVVAGDGALREVNPAGLILFEAERAEEVVGRTLSEFLAPPHREAFRSYVERVGGGHKGSLEVEMAGLKGGARTVLVRAAPLEKPGRGASLLVMARDVTEMRELEADLRESHKMATTGQFAVKCHLGHISTILLNLCANARDAMPQGGSLTIELGNVKREGFGECVRLTVSDTGAGMDAEVSRRIFEPFFMTKEGRQGIGLGLTVVQSLVYRLAGVITVESEPGRGSRFVIDIPRLVPQDTTVEPAPAEPPTHTVPSGTGQVILVVDDEEILRVVARAALEQAGYVVLEAEAGADAIEILQREGARIAAVLLDVMMPGRSGVEVFEDLHELAPSVPVIFCSGSISEKKGAALIRGGAKAFLHKPYSAHELTDVVRQILQPDPNH